ncbi:FAD-binding oxidoreductase [Microbacterium sp. P5_E9]
MTTPAIVADLLAALPVGTVVTDPDTLERCSHDDAEWAEFARPAAVVFATSVDEVSTAVRIAAAHGVPVVPRGAGTGLSGGANATAGCLVLSLERMTRILEVEPAERYAVVEAGVLNDDLRRHVATQGLWYPPDPASQSISTIGGNVATNAGGICCVKYGVTRDYVLGLTVVLADGRVARVGRRTAKGVTGYDLTGLLVGSEGTLGIIVEVTLKLLPLGGREERAIIGYFPSLTDAGHAVAAVSAAGIVPSALELIDRTCLHAVAEWQGWTLPDSAQTLLLAKVDEVGERGEELAARIAGLFAEAGGTEVQRASDPDAIDRLFAARRLAYPALERLGPVLTEDVCVPRSAVPEMLARIERAAADEGVVIANIAHAGDGNLHPLIIAPEGDDEAKRRAKRAFDRIVDDCRALGGTVTGEHGVGLLKLTGAAEELSPVVLELHSAIKRALDPHDILNPGKAFPNGA